MRTVGVWAIFFFTTIFAGILARGTLAIALGAWDALPDHTPAIRFLVAAVVSALPAFSFVAVLRSALRQGATLAR